MRRLLAPAVVFGLLIGTMGVAGAAGSSAPGVTKDEIKLGVTYVDLDAIRDVTDINHGDYEATYNAVIDELNKKGGVNGRKIVPGLREDQPDRHCARAGSVPEAHRGREGLRHGGLLLSSTPRCATSRKHDTPILGGTMNPDVPEPGEGAVDDPRLRSRGDPAGGRRAGRSAARSRASSGIVDPRHRGEEPPRRGRAARR